MDPDWFARMDRRSHVKILVANRTYVFAAPGEKLGLLESAVNDDKNEYLLGLPCYRKIMLSAPVARSLPRFNRFAATVLLLCTNLATIDANAAGWPTPAAGPSTSKGPEIVLTFDDGPNPRTTPQVLDILKARGLKAIFFIVGEMVEGNKKGRALIARIEAEGHIVATHTMTHQDLCRVTEEKAASDIDRGQEAVRKVATTSVVWFRAPYGAKCKRLEDMLSERGMKHFHWDLDPQEWKHNDPVKTVDYVTGEMGRTSSRNVLLLHDVKDVTIEALPQILDWIDAQNKERAAIGKKPIRIVPGWELAREKLAPGLWKWLAATGEAADIRTAIAQLLP
jgi:peptidoglycan-N-acetylglucosamine deacetylase